MDHSSEKTPKQYRLSRYIAVFAKTTGAYEGKILLTCQSLEVLQQIFEVSADDPMYEAWDVTAKEMKKLIGHGMLLEPLDLERYDYELHASRV